MTSRNLKGRGCNIAGAYKRYTKAKKYTGWYLDESGKRRTFAGTVDKKITLQMAEKRETEAKQIREGLVDPAVKARQDALGIPIERHLSDWQDDLVARDNKPKYCHQLVSQVRRLLAEARIHTLGDLTGDKIQSALGRWREQGMSAKSRNEALRGLKSWAMWLDYADRLKEVPKSLKKIRPSNVEADRRLIRRSLTEDELARLLDTTEASVKERFGLSGPDRAMVYRLAAGTGFRVNELRSLTPERFHLDGSEPFVVVPAEHTKNGREAKQPISTALARRLKPWIEGKEPRQAVVELSQRTARMLKADLEDSGIPYKDKDGRTADFHALRYTYITRLIRKGVNPKVVQALARHSSISLTLNIYTSVDDNEKRKALEGD